MDNSTISKITALADDVVRSNDPGEYFIVAGLMEIDIKKDKRSVVRIQPNNRLLFTINSLSGLFTFLQFLKDETDDKIEFWIPGR